MSCLSACFGSYGTVLESVLAGATEEREEKTNAPKLHNCLSQPNKTARSNSFAKSHANCLNLDFWNPNYKGLWEMGK